MNMDTETIRDKVLQCMNNIGLCVLDDAANFNLDEYIVDSVMYVSFIIELEQMFDIEIPDEYLMISGMRTLDDICMTVEKILEDKQSQNRS